jgi:PAS domain S-box-containing protein
MKPHFSIPAFQLRDVINGDSEDILSTILNEAPDMIYVAELQTRSIVYINARVKEILGLTEDEIYIKGFDFFPDLVHPDDYLKRMDQMSSLANQSNGEMIEIEARMQVKDGSFHWFRIGERIFNRTTDGQPEKIIGIATDIHKQKVADEELKKMAREIFKKNRQLVSINADLESFNRIAAKEFIETLQTIYTALEFIAIKDGERHTYNDHANIRRAQSYVQKLRLMTHDVTAYLRISQMNRSSAPVDLNRALNHALGSLPEKTIEMSLQLATLPIIKGDPMLLSLLFKNLLENSVKFRKEGQGLEVRIHYFKADEINFHSLALKDTPYHIVSLRDNGIGFEQEESERIFTIFYRVGDRKKHSGPGVGLAACKKIMELHGGFIEAESSPGEGANFTCFFPEEDENFNGL